MKKFTTAVAAAAGAMVLVSTLAVTPAMAEQGKSLGSKSCTVNVATTVRATGSQRHDVNADYKTFDYSGSYVTRNFYPLVKVANTSYAKVSGVIASGSLFCDY